MTEKNVKNIKYNNTKISIRLLILTFCLMLLPFDLLSFINGSASANSENMVEYNLNNQEQEKPAISTGDIQKSLWRTNITPAEEKKEQDQKDELKSLIEQINMMSLSLPAQSFESTDIDRNVKVEEPEKNTSINENSQKNVKKANSGNNSNEVITEKTLSKLKKIAENPQKIDNPYEIGNTLYLSNCIGEAATFYQEALRRNKPEDRSSSEDRAWLLFQTANSLQSLDMIEADNIYKKLITEFPESPWTEIARVQSNLISWYSKDKPDELMKEYKR